MLHLEFLKDPNGQLSSKRLVGVVAFANAMVFVWVFVALGKLGASDGLNAFLAIVGAGLFFNTADHWAPRA